MSYLLQKKIKTRRLNMKEKLGQLVNVVKDNPGKAIAIGVGSAILAVVAVKAVQYVVQKPELLAEIAETLEEA